MPLFSRLRPGCFRNALQTRAFAVNKCRWHASRSRSPALAETLVHEQKLEVIMKTRILIIAACALTSGVLAAEEPVDPIFRASEFSLDLFGSGSVGQETLNHISGEKVRDDGRLGAGVGGNFFFNRFFGLSGDAYTENTGHSFVDDASGSIVFRIPIEPIHLAPYVFAGGGYQFDPIEQAFLHAGAGLEYRFLRNAGIFVDARYVATEDSKDFGLGRLGFRFVF
jgi:hypothetical protein